MKSYFSKKSLLSLLIVISVNAGLVFSQSATLQKPAYNPVNFSPNYFQIKKDLEGYFKNAVKDKSESGEEEHFERMNSFWQPRLAPHGNFDAYYKGVTEARTQSNCGPFDIADKYWKEIGPHKDMLYHPSCSTRIHGIGPVSYLTFDPDDTNKMFAGSWSSGMFYTEDGAGTWTNGGTDKFPIVSTSFCVSTKGASTKAWFLSTGGGNTIGGPSDSRSDGVWRTFNNGATWEHVGNYVKFGTYWCNGPYSGDPNNPCGTPALTNIYWNWSINNLLSDPTNASNFYLTSSNGIYKSVNAMDPNPSNVTWQRTYPSSPAPTVEYNAFSVIFKPALNSSCTSCNTLFATSSEVDWANSNATDCKIITSTNSGATWAVVPNTYAVTQNCRKAEVRISQNNPNIMYILVWPNTTKTCNLYSYNISTQVISGVLSTLNLDQGRSKSLSVSPTNYLQLAYGEIHPIWLSSNGGMSWTNTELGSQTHDDHDMTVFDPSGQYLWATSHGGIFKYNLSTQIWTEHNYGLGTAEVLDFDDATNSAAKMFISCNHDGGTISTAPYVLDNWDAKWERTPHFGDGLAAAIDEVGNNLYYANQFNSPYRNINNTGWTFMSIPISTADWVAKFEINTTNNNALYFANRELARSMNTGANWQLIGDFSLAPYNNPVKLLVSAVKSAPSNGNYLYAAFVGKSSSSAPIDVFKLYYTTQALNSSAATVQNSWIEIPIPWSSPIGNPQPKWITNIIVDATDPKVGYIVIGGYADVTNPGPYTDKVFKFDLNTNIVTDMTSNLPNIGVTAIVQHKSADNTIFIGTDKGVYYTNNTIIGSNPSAIWSCYGTGFPNRPITGLKVNKCAGTLRAATIGRGVWEVELPEEKLLTQTISGTYNPSGTIIIKSGNVVTVTGTINMPAKSKIIIERGAKLAVNGGTITTACGTLWRGIEVWGDVTRAQTIVSGMPQYQGMIVLTNNAKIENAINGITTIKYDANDNVDWSYTGGIVQATNSIFRNNRRDVEFMYYRNFNPNVPTQTRSNISFFKNCNFKVDNLLADPLYLPYARVSMYAVQGIVFSGNNFNLTNNANKGYGILSIDAGYNIIDICNNPLVNGVTGEITCGSTVSNQFSGFDYGIHASCIQNFLPIIVDHCTFSNNVYGGIYMGSVNYSKIINNTFNVNGPTGLQPDYGLYLDQSTGYKVENNIFTQPGTNNNHAGIFVDNSGDNANSIYNNTFTNMAFGIMALNDNNGSGTSDGLIINCNDFTNCNYNVGVYSSTSGSVDGIEKYQSSGLSLNEYVRNTYSAPSCVGENKYYVNQVNSNCVPIIHYSFSTASTKPNQPTGCSNNSEVSVLGNTGTFDKLQYCPSTLTGGATNRSSNLAATKASIEKLKDNLALLKDGGNIRDSLETQLAFSKTSVALLLDEKIRNFLNDTIITNPMDSVIHLLKTENTIADKDHKLISAYVRNNEFELAKSKIELIKSINKKDHYCRFQEIVIQLKQHADYCYSIKNDMSVKEELTFFMNDSDGLCYKNAQAVINKVFNTRFQEDLTVPKNSKESEISDINNENNNKVIIDNIKIYPNPANNQITVEFIVPNKEPVNLSIQDVSGKIVKTVMLNSEQKQVFDLSGFSNGLYIISIQKNSVIISRNKLVISH